MLYTVPLCHCAPKATNRGRQGKAISIFYKGKPRGPIRPKSQGSQGVFLLHRVGDHPGLASQPLSNRLPRLGVRVRVVLCFQLLQACAHPSHLSISVSIKNPSVSQCTVRASRQWLQSRARPKKMENGESFSQLSAQRTAVCILCEAGEMAQWVKARATKSHNLTPPW